MATNLATPAVRFFSIMIVSALAMLHSTRAIAARPAISEDRELKEIDLTGWNCRDTPEGTAKTPEGGERNRLKNRAPTDLKGMDLKALDTASFLQHVAAFEAHAKNMRRKDLNADQRRQLDPLEKQIVSFTGYLVLAYPGPPESTNCASTDFHDWHLELFEKPQDHAPQIGDPTPIICEITPRTQSAIYRDNVRIQALAAFVRAPDLTIEPTGHPARKVRVTGYLLWDDEHNGAADVGTTIRTFGANKYHQPWRSTAWEIHPAIKIEAIDGSAVSPPTIPTPTPPAPVPSAKTNPALPPAAPQQQQFITLLQPVRLKVPYGEALVPRGTKLPVVSHDAKSVIVRYLDNSYPIPIEYTDFR
ncbi:MAG: hypothetical protein QOH88_797 [Verrucomicrobiota bacterium]